MFDLPEPFRPVTALNCVSNGPTHTLPKFFVNKNDIFHFVFLKTFQKIFLKIKFKITCVGLEPLNNDIFDKHGENVLFLQP